MTPPKTPFDSLLVANRGEAAARIARTARRLGIRTIGVATDPDRGNPGAGSCDVVVPLGAPDGYLSADRLLAAAAASGARAVHPGWGFLAETADFARAVEAAGLVWVGPSPEAITLMGDKAAARRAVADLGLPVLPGREVGDESPDELAAAVGWPLLVKAVAGGGGRGLRRVTAPDELGEALRSARSEALAAFGEDRVLLERWVPRARHVEVQVIGDRAGSVLTLGDRDCSIQRRHQKVVEEAPAPDLPEATRRRMHEIALTVARSISYVGAGTVELLLDLEGGEIWFLEMNTRLQVEHPVTEAILGLDLVELQLRVAAGEPLGIRQEELETSGHAIEARLIAEEPGRAFRPAAGRVVRWRPPEAPGIRVDHAVAEGLEVSPWYDALLAKVVAHGRDRDQARRRLLRALEETVILGVETNREFLLEVLASADVVAGPVATSWLEAWHGERAAGSEARTGSSPRASTPTKTSRSPDQETLWALAALALSVPPGAVPDPWRSTGEPARWTLDLLHRDRRETIRLQLEVAEAARFATPGQAADLRLTASWGGREVARRVRWSEHGLLVEGAGGERSVEVVREGRAVFLQFGSSSGRFERVEGLVAEPTGRPDGKVRAPLAGRVSAVRVSLGDRVQVGDQLAAIDSMKMETWVHAGCAGVVSQLRAAPGRQVRVGEVLVEVCESEDGV